MSRANLDEDTERRVIEVRKKLHAIGFPGDLMDDEVLAGSLVLVRTDGWWEVVPGWRIVSMFASTEWVETTSTYEPGRLEEVRTCTIHLIGPHPGFETWPPGPVHVFAFDEIRFFLGHLVVRDLRARPDRLPAPLVEIGMESVGHFQIDLWDNCPANPRFTPSEPESPAGRAASPASPPPGARSALPPPSGTRGTPGPGSRR